MEEEGYHMLFFFRNFGQQLVESLCSGRADGIFVIQSDAENHQMQELAENHIPMVSVNYPAPGQSPETTSEVLPDTPGMMRDAIADFVRNGCRRIALMNKRTPANQAMNQAFFSVCEELASQGVDGMFVERPAPDELENCLTEMVRGGQMPEALFINRFEYAEATCRILTRLGIIPGKEILIAACSPEEAPEFVPYAMTLYLHDGATIGKIAWEQMKKLLVKNARPLERRLVPYQKLVFQEQTVLQDDKS